MRLFGVIIGYHVRISDFQRMHDIILRYSVSENVIWNQLYQNRTASTERRIKDGKQIKEVKGSYGQRLIRESDIQSPGAALNDHWYIPVIAGSAHERTGYPTQKPVALLERIIKASSNQGDTVLDPFCGSGTTLRAAKTLGRKYIGIDQNPEAIRISENRLNPPQQELFTA